MCYIIVSVKLLPLTDADKRTGFELILSISEVLVEILPAFVEISPSFDEILSYSLRYCSVRRDIAS